MDNPQKKDPAGDGDARMELPVGVIEGDRIQIFKGLSIGDHLIVSGHTEVEEGMKVEVK